MSGIRRSTTGTFCRLLIAVVIGIAAFAIGQSSCYAQSHPIRKVRPTKGIIDQLMESEANGLTIDASESHTKLIRQMQFDTADREDEQVQHAYYDDAGPNDLREVSHDLQASENERRSFIERERAASSTKRTSDSEGPGQLATRLAINLMLVLGLAVTAIVGVKHWQKMKDAAPFEIVEGSALRIETTLPLPNGASLHLVEVSQSKFLIAVDSTGIKSIEALANGFQETMNQVESQMPSMVETERPSPEPPVQVLSQRIRTRAKTGVAQEHETKPVPKPTRKTRSKPKAEREPEPAEEFDPDEDTKDIDAKLINFCYAGLVKPHK